MKEVKEDDQTATNTIKFIIGENEVDNFAKTFEEIEKENVGELSLNKSNLEDAFIKLGTQETEGDGVVPDIPDVELPKVMCTYSFQTQFKAVFVKKAIVTLRSLSSLFSLILPTIFIIAGVVVAVIAIPGDQ